MQKKVVFTMNIRHILSDNIFSRGIFREIAKDDSGNTLALFAASLFPILAMIGGAVDIGLAYAAQSRLQQACDAGVLAARKHLGANQFPSDDLMNKVQETGHSFFNLNFPDGRYDAKNRKFTLAINRDHALDGTASINMPTTIMKIFGYYNIPIKVNCQSRLTFTNLDIMMALDVTISMEYINDGDTIPRIDAMRDVIKQFYDNLEGSKSPGDRIRYGFVPYSNSVNVGASLKDEWVVNGWYYQSRSDVTVNGKKKWKYHRKFIRVPWWFKQPKFRCVEERKSTQLTNFTNVDLTENPDLDINLVPTPGDIDTQWRPAVRDYIWSRSLLSYESENWTTEEVITDEEFFAHNGKELSKCTTSAQKLQEITRDELDAYLNTLEPRGATYHDIGMIWAGRFLSQNGLFAEENADVSPDSPTSRHLIFLTDGQSYPNVKGYGVYGIEPLDQRRWSPSSPLSLKEIVDQRFGFACDQVKKNNNVVWIITFGTEVNDIMKDCAGPGHYFETNSAVELDRAFRTIALSMGNLRISK